MGGVVFFNHMAAMYCDVMNATYVHVMYIHEHSVFLIDPTANCTNGDVRLMGGALCVQTDTGRTSRPQWSADNWDTAADVSVERFLC